MANKKHGETTARSLVDVCFCIITLRIKITAFYDVMESCNNMSVGKLSQLLCT